MGEGTGLVAVAVGAVDVLDVMAEATHAIAAVFGDAGGLIRGIVEDLDLEFFAGVVEFAGAFDDALGDVHFVVHRKLDGDFGEFGEFAGGLGDFFVVLVVEIDLQITVEAVDREDAKGQHVEANQSRMYSPDHGRHR